MDHRTKVAEKKRGVMRAKLLDAAMRVCADNPHGSPVIDDVIQQAKVSRGTFYKYFDSMEEVLVTLGRELNDQMTADILPVYDVLVEPWQRAAVGFRLFLVRALLDRKWAGFVTRVDVWPHNTLLARYMTKDLEEGKAAGQFSFELVEAAADFIGGATARCIQAIRDGVGDPNAYIDSCVRMALATLGCDRALAERAVAFSITYLRAWASGELTAAKPLWAANMKTRDGKLFLAHAGVMEDLNPADAERISTQSSVESK